MSNRWVSLVAVLLVASVSSAAALAQGGPPMPGNDPALSAGSAKPEPAPILGGSYIQPEAPCCDGHDAPFTPYMLGDFVGPIANLFSDVKIAEGESPRPLNRVFYKFNYYNNLEKSRWTDPTEPIHNVDLYRHSLGGEFAFLEQRMSLGVRVPFYTVEPEAKEFRLLPAADGTVALVPGGPGFSTMHFGNLSAILKTVVWEDRQTGNLISAGATLSFPTASSQKINPGMSTLAYMQPFGAFIMNRGDLFVQGFSSITLPLARPESILLFTDLGVGYYLYRDNSGAGRLTGIAPTVEVHVATPLRQPDRTVDLFGFVDGIRLHNVVNFTMGTTLEFANRATIGLAFVIPVTGPKPFDFEGLAQLNYRF